MEDLKMKIITETRKIDITLRYFNGTNLDQDCFNDLEDAFMAGHKMLEGSDEYIATDEEVNDLIDFWKDNCKTANAGYDHNEYIDHGDYKTRIPEDHILWALSDEQLENGGKWILDVDETIWNEKTTLTIVNSCSVDRDEDEFEEIVSTGYNEEAARSEATKTMFHSFCIGDKPCHLENGKMVEYFKTEGLLININNVYLDEDEIADLMGWDYAIVMKFNNKVYALPNNYKEYYEGGKITTNEAKKYDSWVEVAENAVNNTNKSIL